MTISRAVVGDPGLQHLDGVYRMARRLTSEDAAAAEQLVQQTFRSLRGRAIPPDLDGFAGRQLLFRTLYELHVRRVGVVQQIPSVAQVELAGGNIPDDRVLGALNSAPVDTPFIGIVESLPCETQVVLLLWAVEELSLQDISYVLGMPAAGVNDCLTLAKQELANPFAHAQRLNQLPGK